MIASPQPFLTPEEYLKLEEQHAVKHEYRDGVNVAVPGADDAHVTITGNLLALLRSRVRGSNCRLYFTDMKARLEAQNRFYYPDILVTCDPRDTETPLYKRFPKLIVEVLSSSTEAFDRGDKFADYQTLDSLEEYVLISTKRQRVECLRRNANGLWELQFYIPELLPPDQQTFHLHSIGFESAIAPLYEDVTFAPEIESSDSVNE